jgi:uncharacterized protein
LRPFLATFEFPLIPTQALAFHPCETLRAPRSTMKDVNVPLSALNPSLEILFNPPQVESAQGKPTHGKARVLSWSDLDTPWLHAYFEERGLLAPAPEALSLHVTLRKEGALVRARVELRQTPQLECVRSLTEFREEIVSEQEAFFASEDDLPDGGRGASGPGGERELDEAELSTYAFVGNMLSLDAFLLDALETSLPDHPVCRPDCKGLCVECGVVLNDRGTCGLAKPSLEECPHFPAQLN